jgi:trehalose/maltose hydrolase-like predicted phosphorylase
MKSLNDLFDLIKQSDVTLIGYTFQDEKIKDELISNFNYIDVVEIDSSFSFKSLLIF